MAVQWRHAPMRTSDFQDSHNTHGTAAARVNNQMGLENWKFIQGRALCVLRMNFCTRWFKESAT